MYRWWPNKGALVVDAFASSTEQQAALPRYRVGLSDISLQMKQVIAIFRSRRGRIVAALLGGGQSDPELMEAFRERFVRPRRREAYKTLRRGIERGELPRNLDLDLMLEFCMAQSTCAFSFVTMNSVRVMWKGCAGWCWMGQQGSGVRRLAISKFRPPEPIDPFVSGAARRVLARTEW